VSAATVDVLEAYLGPGRHLGWQQFARRQPRLRPRLHRRDPGCEEHDAGAAHEQPVDACPLIANALDALPKRLQPRAKTLLHQMMEAPSEADARRARETFRAEFAAKYPKAIARLDRDWKALTAFYAFPAEQWRHLRTTTPIESSFATVKLRTRVTKGAGSKQAALGMAFKLLKTAEERWRRFNGHELVADVLAGAQFKDGPDQGPRRAPDAGREGRRLSVFTPTSSTTLDNCSGTSFPTGSSTRRRPVGRRRCPPSRCRPDPPC